MSAFQRGDRVILRRNGRETPGRVTSVVDDEHVYVALDSGVRCTFPVSDLVPDANRVVP